MSTTSRAGASADRRYRALVGAWRRTVMPKVILTVLPLLASAGVFSAIHRPFLAGFLAGGAAVLVLFAWDSPPQFIEAWRSGRNGERRTARQLSSLDPRTWFSYHDLGGSGEQRDHIVVGPAGIFLINSKERSGELTTVADTPVSQRLGGLYHSPPENVSAAARGSAWALHAELGDRGLPGCWVQPVVAIWGRFRCRPVLAERVAFVHGDELTGWLQSQPERLAAHQVRRLREILESFPPAIETAWSD